MKKYDRFLSVGLMSGTSCDGVSAVLIEVNFTKKTKIKLLAYETYPFTKRLQAKILALPYSNAKTICEANFMLGEIFAQSALKIIKKAGFIPQNIDVIGSHGQTICHLPNSEMPSTFQIGEPSLIAERTGITTVADFRCRDIAAGGEGAPLIPYLDYVLFGKGDWLALQNIGGIANVAVVGKDFNKTMAFDTGPGNMLIDEAVRNFTNGKLNYDKNGNFAKKGGIIAELLNCLHSHIYFKKPPPKSCGREEFGRDFFEQYCSEYLKKSPFDTIATLTYFTAESIARAYCNFILKQCLIKEIIVSGGGVYNPVLMSHLSHLFNFAKLRSIAEYGIHPLAKEPMAFALLACETIRGKTNNVPSATGAKAKVILGKIIPGKNYKHNL